MRGLVAKDVQAGVAAAEHDECQDVRPPGVEVTGQSDNAERQREGVQHGADIAHVVDVAELIAQLALGHAASIEPIGRQNIGKQICRWHHRGHRGVKVGERSHGVMIHSAVVMNKIRNIWVWVCWCWASGSDEVGMACNDA